VTKTKTSLVIKGARKALKFIFSQKTKSITHLRGAGHIFNLLRCQHPNSNFASDLHITIGEECTFRAKKGATMLIEDRSRLLILLRRMLTKRRIAKRMKTKL